MGIFDEADRFYRKRKHKQVKEETRIEVQEPKKDRKDFFEVTEQEQYIAPSSEYDGAFEILGIDIEDVPQEKQKKTKEKKKMKVPIVNIKPL